MFAARGTPLGAEQDSDLEKRDGLGEFSRDVSRGMQVECNKSSLF